MLCKIFFIYILVNIYMVILTNEAEEFVSTVLNKKSSNSFSFAGKNYYVQSVFKANFYRALQFCRQQGMQLLTINSQQENYRISKFIHDNGLSHGYFWASGTNLVGDNEWVWLSSGLNFKYSNWHPGEPSGKNLVDVPENCLELRPWIQAGGISWNDKNCQAELYFICESLPNCPADVLTSTK